MTVPRELAFDLPEFRTRLAAVQTRLAQRRLDALVLFAPGTINYLSGFDNDNLSDITALIVPLDREPVLVLFWFEAGRAENTCWLDDVRLYRSPADLVPGPGAIGAIIDALRSLGLTRSKLGIEKGPGALSVSDHEELIAGLPEAQVEDPFLIVETVRRRKSQAELAYMRRAAEITDAAVAAGTKALAVGVRDTDVAAVIVETLTRLGSELPCLGPIVAAGWRSGSPHSTHARQVLRVGETVFLELTAQVRRYTAPLMRTGILGAPTPEQARAAEAGAEAIATIFRTARPGVRASDVARAAMAPLEPVLPGLMFHGNFGYPVGLGYPPTWSERLGFYLKADNDEPLEAGMTFHLPVSLRRYGEWGICQSHTLLVTDTGAEPLTRSEPRLQVIS